MVGSVYQTAQTLFSYKILLIFDLESCLKVSDNLVLNGEIDFDKSSTLSSLIYNVIFNLSFLITLTSYQSYIGNYIIVHHFISLSGEFMARTITNTCEIGIRTNLSFI